MPYLRLTCPPVEAARRRQIAVALTDVVMELFTPPRGPRAAEIRERTTIHIVAYRDDELFIAGVPVDPARPDVTAEVSDWSMSTRRQRRVATVLTKTLVGLFAADPDAVNVRFHPYPPADFAVGGTLLHDRVPRAARLAKRLLG